MVSLVFLCAHYTTQLPGHLAAWHLFLTMSRLQNLRPPPPPPPPLPPAEKKFKAKWATLKADTEVAKPKPTHASLVPLEGIWLFLLLSLMYWSVVITAYKNI